jgi:hypothetical protein
MVYPLKIVIFNSYVSFTGGYRSAPDHQPSTWGTDPMGAPNIRGSLPDPQGCLGGAGRVNQWLPAWTFDFWKPMDGKKKHGKSYENYWLVVSNMTGLFSIYGMSSFPLTHIFSEGWLNLQPAMAFFGYFSHPQTSLVFYSM